MLKIFRHISIVYKIRNNNSKVKEKLVSSLGSLTTNITEFSKITQSEKASKALFLIINVQTYEMNL